MDRQMAEVRTVLPFLCDDIFDTFDVDRTAAACHLMRRIGEVGLALHFKHHAHFAEIAERECPACRFSHSDCAGATSSPIYSRHQWLLHKIQTVRGNR